MSTLAHAYRLLARMYDITDGQPGQRTVSVYARALRSAIDQGDEERILRGIAICRPLVDAVEALDLQDTPC